MSTRCARVVIVLVVATGLGVLMGSGRPEPEEPASSGLARRPTPVFPERAEAGTWLRPLPTHRKMGSVYHTISASRFEVSGVAVRPNLQPPVGYAVARLPMSSGADGTIGSVLLGGQWLVAWSSLLDEQALRVWKQSGSVKFDQFPDVGFTIRAAVDTRELSKNEWSSSYSCTVIADVTINGVTTEAMVPRVILTLSRASGGVGGGVGEGVGGGERRVKGDQLSLRGRWKLRMSDFMVGAPAGVPPVVDVSVEMLCATVPPEFQGEGGVPPKDDAPDEVPDEVPPAVEPGGVVPGSPERESEPK